MVRLETIPGVEIPSAPNFKRQEKEMLTWNWQNRPADERYDTLDGMRAEAYGQRQRSSVRDAAVEHLGVRANDEGELQLIDTENKAHRFSNWSFGQLCREVKDTRTGKSMTASEYQTLPAAIAQIPMQWRIENCRRADTKLLYTEDETVAESEVRALTSPSYGRVWNSELIDALTNYVDPAVWKPVNLTELARRDTTALTLSDRDCYAFLVDDQHPIEVPGANGRDTLYRGFYAWNSETGHRSIGISGFLFRSACANRQIYGMKDFEQLRIRHTSGAPDRWMREALPELKAYLNADTADTVKLIGASRNKQVGKTNKDVLEWLKARKFTAALSRAAMEKAEEEEGNPRSLWNLVQGFSALARDKTYQDERVDLESKAGKLMRFAA
jgi:hypothetical protein